MAAELGTGQSDDRVARLETTVREIEKLQTELRSDRASLKWMAGLVVAILVAVTGVGLARSFVLSDRVADVQVDTAKIATAIGFVSDDVSEIKSDVKAIRSELANVAAAVGATRPDEKKAELETGE
jgi:hypothetical protein